MEKPIPIPVPRPTREDTIALLKEYNSNDSLIAHALAVEAVMRYMAKKNGENEDEWGVIGLIHDLDYEQFPDEHCKKTKEILEQQGWPDSYIRAVLSHGWELCTDVEPHTNLEKTLYAIDELTGFITACALVRPSKSVMDLKVKSAKKKWKQKNFAASVNREVIEKGAAMLNVTLEELIADVITAMQGVSKELGL